MHHSEEKIGHTKKAKNRVVELRVTAEELLSKLNNDDFSDDKDKPSELSITQTNDSQLEEILDLLDKKRLSDKIKKLKIRGDHTHKLTALPESIGNLTSLTTLDLSLNQLTALPETIGKLNRLTKLDLSYNKLKKLPNLIGNLKRLTKLDLGNNELKALPESIGELPRLTELHLYINQLKAIPDSIGELPRLTTLDLNHNQLTALPETFGKLTILTWLNLGHNKLKALPETFGKLTNLTKLDLRYNQLTKLHYQNTTGNLCSTDRKFWTEFNSQENTTTPSNMCFDSQGNTITLNNLRPTDCEHKTGSYQKTLPFSIGNLTKLNWINGTEISDLPNWPNRKLWVAINAVASFTGNHLPYLNKDPQLLVLDYLYPGVNACKLSDELRPEAEEILKKLEQIHSAAEAAKETEEAKLPPEIGTSK